MTLGSTFLSGLSTYQVGAVRLLSYPGALFLNVALFSIAFRVLTRRSLRLADVLLGALVGATFWTGLQMVGTYFVTHRIRQGIIGLREVRARHRRTRLDLLRPQITLYSAEINVVRNKRLWPRSFLGATP